MESTKTFLEHLTYAFQNEGISRTYQKGEFLIKEGECEKSIYKIISGAVRAFYLTEHEEQIIRLGYKNNMITSLSSFFSGQPSELYIEAIRKTEVVLLSRDQLYKVVQTTPESIQGYQEFLEKTLSQQVDRELDLLITSPQERLRRVLSRSPDLFQEIPLKYIASYLRMTPETLSRIRKS